MTTQTRSRATLTLRVAEALPKDVGRGIARMDPEYIEKIGAEVGDVLEIEGKRKAAAKIMPTFMNDRDKKIIQIDGLTRENAKVGLDEKVTIKKITCSPAQKITLSPTTPTKSTYGDRDRRYLGRLLEGLPVAEGDRVRAALFGAREREFTVVSTVPKGTVLIRSTTSIQTTEQGARSNGLKISYEDIGGLHRETRKIREMIELPLKYPQVFERLGIDAPKGVLLYGPPGCGKTLIARAVANETNASFFSLSGPEIMHKFYGESEAHLRSLFEKASASAPSIIFLDEIDALAPKREELGGEKQVERRVVAQLLALMDGLKSRGRVIVIGATNIPNMIDPALRRPGRFDREIEISIPDKIGRQEILEIHMRGMPLAHDVDIQRLAELTHGYVGADLEALCREAAMCSLRKIFPNIDFELEEIPYEDLFKLEVTMDDFKEAFKEVEPSAIREVFTEVPDVRWDDIGGLAEIKQALRETIEWPLKYEKLFEYTNTRPPKGILLHGIPGTGKTLLAKAVATVSEANFISVKGPALLTKWVGESEKGIREVFKKAKQASPCIIFFDEIDSLAPVRGGSGGSQVTERVISQFLTELDGIEELKGVVVLAATNRADIIDPALLRAGRFDLLVEMPVPDKEARLEIFKVHTRGKPLSRNVNMESLAAETEDLVGADIESICQKASMLAIREFLEKTPENGHAYEKLKIAKKHFDEAVSMVKSSRELVSSI